MPITQPATAAVAHPARTGGRFYRPELDALRFLAFMLVFELHTILVPKSPALIHKAGILIQSAGESGVPLFFVLSSYLLTEILFIEKAATKSINIPAFYKRRILRIWPLYFAILFTTAFVGIWVPAAHVKLGAFLAYVFLSGNLYTCVYGWLPPIIGPLWSISVEEQFYLAWPSLIRKLSRKSLSVACIGTVVFSLAAVAVLCAHHATLFPQVGSNTLVDVGYFALGALVSLSLKGTIPTFSPIGRLLLFSLGAFLILAGASILDPNLSEVYLSASHGLAYISLTAGGATTVLLSFLGMKISSRLSPIVYLGKISYGLYMFHQIWVTLVSAATEHFHLKHGNTELRWLVALPLTILTAYLSYNFFEKPFLRMKERFTIVKSRGI